MVVVEYQGVHCRVQENQVGDQEGVHKEEDLGEVQVDKGDCRTLQE